MEEEHNNEFKKWQEAIQRIERLNNIINELEKFVKNCNEYNSKCNSTIYEGRAFEDSVILYKIKELKGSNGAIPPEVIGTNGEDGGLFDYGDR